tara:strand:- start:262 stop:648 length:387 start_codon:yes stop_codon:yes gene_type:complete
MSLLSRIRAAVRGWQELRELSRTAPQRLAAVADRERAAADASRERTENLKRALSAPFVASEGIVEESKERATAQIDERVGQMLDQITVDEAAVRRRAVERMASEMEELLSKQPDAAMPQSPPKDGTST